MHTRNCISHITLSTRVGHGLTRQSRQQITTRSSSQTGGVAQLVRAGMHKGYQEACKLLDTIRPLPELIVWDLDYTLWPFWCEMYSVNDTPSLYADSMGILQACRDHKVPMAIASRTPTPRVAQAFMHKLGITELFDSIQLIPASSGVDHHSAQKDKAHFPRIQKETGVPLSGMLFFDDESPNIAKVSRLGVTSILAPSGVSVQLFEKGLREHAKRSSANGLKQ